jgi:hypothetical protein
MAPAEQILTRILFYTGMMAFSVGCLMMAGRLAYEAFTYWVGR